MTQAMIRCGTVLALNLALLAAMPALYSQQASPQSTAPANSSPAAKKPSHAHDFLLRGTVFTNTAYAFPGAEIRVRRSGEKKYRWETFTNSRGEFAIRVPQGSEYELRVHGKGFVDQNRAIDAKAGNLEEGITFQMQPVQAVQAKPSGGKT